MSTNSNLSRRTALKLSGSSLAAIGASGLAAGNDHFVEVNVGYDGDGGRGAALDAASEVVREFAFDALTVRVPRQATDALANRAGVRYVEENGTWQAFDSVPCGVESIDAPDSWSCGCGSGADIAIIDTGIQSTHSDLGPNVGDGVAVTNCSSSDCGCYHDWDDDNGHGTHVAGTAAAPDGTGGIVGVSPCSTLHAVKVLNSWGGGSYSDIAAGIEVTADRGWDVANLSLGGSSGSQTVKDACTYAYNRGVLLVAAAGDSGSAAYPAAYSEVMAVSAVDCNGNVPSFTAGSPNTEICAPGQDIYSTYTCDTHQTLSGTSMAAPHVAGVGALLMANGYDNVGARQRMHNTACDLGLAWKHQGHGRVDADAATGCGNTC